MSLFEPVIRGLAGSLGLDRLAHAQAEAWQARAAEQVCSDHPFHSELALDSVNTRLCFCRFLKKPRT